MNIYGNPAMIELTWAQRPTFAQWPKHTPIFFTDIGANLELGDIGSQWYHDGVRWRPWGGVCKLYALGNSFQTKSTDLTTASILASARVPAGLIMDSHLEFEILSIITKSGTSNGVNNQIYIGSTGTTADDTLQTATTPTTTSRQRQDARFTFRGTTDTTTARPYSGISAYSTTTLAPPTSEVAVADWDVVDNFISFGMNLSSGTDETMTLRHFTIYLRG